MPGSKISPGLAWDWCKVSPADASLRADGGWVHQRTLDANPKPNGYFLPAASVPVDSVCKLPPEMFLDVINSLHILVPS